MKVSKLKEIVDKFASIDPNGEVAVFNEEIGLDMHISEIGETMPFLEEETKDDTLELTLVWINKPKDPSVAFVDYWTDTENNE